MQKITRLSCCLFILCSFLFFNGCKPDDAPPKKLIEIALRYDSPQHSYNEASIYSYNNSNYALYNDAEVVSYVHGDSVLMIYTCLIQDTNHRYAQIAISKMFHRNRLDEDANGIYSLKSNQDFRDVFKVGTQSIVYADTSSHRSDGLDMVLGIEATRTLQFKCNYSTGTCAPVQAHLDTVNNFEISEVYFNQFYDAQVDWESFIVNNKKYPSDSKIAWVTIKFRCKLFDSMLPFDSIVFDNGVFSGVFLDRQ